MSHGIDPLRRRLVVAAGGMLGLMWLSPALRAQALLATPPQALGPFYPLELPLDRDNDLVQVAGRTGLAKGEITHLTGRVLDLRGRPVPRARIEIWQVNAYGRYHHPRDRRDRPIDPHFQGYGQYVTGDDGTYRFRTIKPVPYPGRAPHIHFRLSGPGFEPLVTQMYVQGAPENARDFLLNRVHDPRQRARLIVAFEPAPAPAQGTLMARFDIVLAQDGLLERG